MGRSKKANEGRCIACNGPEEVKSALGNIPFCRQCWDALKDEDELEKRFVWED